MCVCIYIYIYISLVLRFDLVLRSLQSKNVRCVFLVYLVLLVFGFFTK